MLKASQPFRQIHRFLILWIEMNFFFPISGVPEEKSTELNESKETRILSQSSHHNCETLEVSFNPSILSSAEILPGHEITSTIASLPCILDNSVYYECLMLLYAPYLKLWKYYPVDPLDGSRILVTVILKGAKSTFTSFWIPLSES